MASRFGQRRLLQDSTESFEQRNTSVTSPLHSSALWWGDGEKQPEEEEGTLREQLNAMDDHIIRLQEMLKYEQTKCSKLQLRCNQQETELKRREQTLTKLKARLSLLTDRQQDKVPSRIKILNTLTSAQGSREQPTAKKNEEGAARLMLERREAELSEAMRLRHNLTSLLHALRCEMEQGYKDGILCVDKRLDQKEQALGDHVTGGVVQSWRQVQKNLGVFTCEGTTDLSTDNSKLITQLQGELKQSQQLVQMQQQLLQNGTESPGPSELANCYFMEEWSRLREQWTQFQFQRQNFEKERRAFTEAAIRLSHERRDFEQLKASLVKQQFLRDSPEFGKESQYKSRTESLDQNFSGIQSLNTTDSSTFNSPAAVSKRGVVRVQTPNTPELYSALGLSYKPCRSVNVGENWNSK